MGQLGTGLRSAWDGKERGGAQCFVFLARVRDPHVGDVWLPDTDGAALKKGMELAVKTPKPVTEPEGDSEGAVTTRTKAQEKADERLHCEVRTPHPQHTPSTAASSSRYTSTPRTHLCCATHIGPHPPYAWRTPGLAGTHPHEAAGRRRAQCRAAARV